LLGENRGNVLTRKLQVAVDLFDDLIIPAEAEYPAVGQPVQPFSQDGPGLTRADLL